MYAHAPKISLARACVGAIHVAHVHVFRLVPSAAVCDRRMEFLGAENSRICVARLCTPFVPSYPVGIRCSTTECTRDSCASTATSAIWQSAVNHHQVKQRNSSYGSLSDRSYSWNKTRFVVHFGEMRSGRNEKGSPLISPKCTTKRVFFDSTQPFHQVVTETGKTFSDTAPARTHVCQSVALRSFAGGASKWDDPNFDPTKDVIDSGISFFLFSYSG